MLSVLLFKDNIIYMLSNTYKIFTINNIIRVIYYLQLQTHPSFHKLDKS